MVTSVQSVKSLAVSWARGRAPARLRAVGAVGELPAVERAVEKPVQRERARRIDDRIHRAAGDRRVLRGGVGIVPVHVVGAGRVERLGDGDGARAGLDGDLQLGIGLLETIGHGAVVVDLPDVEKGVQLLERGGHHQLIGRRRRGERLPRGDQRQHRAGEALLQVLQEQRRRRTVDVDLFWIDLVGIVGRRHLGLLKRQLEEPLHLRRVLGQLHPSLDQRFELRRLRGDGGDLVAGGRQPDQQVLDLGQVDRGGSA